MMLLWYKDFIKIPRITFHLLMSKHLEKNNLCLVSGPSISEEFWRILSTCICECKLCRTYREIAGYGN